MFALKITKVGDTAGLVLPKEVLAKLRVAEGDMVFLAETPNGYRITAYVPEFERQMNLARKVMKKHRKVLRGLAK